MSRQQESVARVDTPLPSTGRRGNRFDPTDDFDAFMSGDDGSLTTPASANHQDPPRVMFQGSRDSSQLGIQASIDCSAQAMVFTTGHKIKVAPPADCAQSPWRSNNTNIQVNPRQGETGYHSFYSPVTRRAENAIRHGERSVTRNSPTREIDPTHVGSSSSSQTCVNDSTLEERVCDDSGPMSGMAQVGGGSTFLMSHNAEPSIPTSSPLDDEQLVRHGDSLMGSSYDLRDRNKRDPISTSMPRKPVRESVIHQHETLFQSEPTPIGPFFEVVDRLESSAIPRNYHQDVLEIFGGTGSCQRPSDDATWTEAPRTGIEMSNKRTTAIPRSSVSFDSETRNESSIDLKNNAIMATQVSSGQWGIRLQNLKRFRDEFGHFRVPEGWSKDPTLYLWIKRQRVQYRKHQKNLYSTMTEERIQALKRLGFVFEVHKRQWEAQFEALARFSEKNGHCNVGRATKDSSLAIWIKYQRLNYKHFMTGKNSNLTAERIALLRQIGLDLEPQSGQNKKRTSKRAKN